MGEVWYGYAKDILGRMWNFFYLTLKSEKSRISNSDAKVKDSCGSCFANWKKFSDKRGMWDAAG